MDDSEITPVIDLKYSISGRGQNRLEKELGTFKKYI